MVQTVHATATSGTADRTAHHQGVKQVTLDLADDHDESEHQKRDEGATRPSATSVATARAIGAPIKG